MCMWDEEQIGPVPIVIGVEHSRISRRLGIPRNAVSVSCTPMSRPKPRRGCYDTLWLLRVSHILPVSFHCLCCSSASCFAQKSSDLVLVFVLTRPPRVQSFSRNRAA